MKAKVVRDNGILKIDINGKLYNPLSFKSFRPNEKNVSEFYDAGIRLFSVLTSGITSALGVPYSLYGESWVGENEYDFSKIDDQMDMFIKNAPDGFFAPMIQLDTREWYLKLHPEVPNSFTHLSQIAYDETWRKAAADYMKKAILHIEEKYGDKVYGYFLLCGTTTEWFSEKDFEASHTIKEKGFKKWTNDENAKLPDLERLNLKGDVFLTPDEKDVYIARKFHSETIADLILYFTGEVQSVLNHNKLLGLYYGYLFELGGERLFNCGTLGYEKVFLSPDIDMISSPSSYPYRKIADPSAFMLTKETLDAHNKLYFLEFDHITHVAPDEIKEGYDENNKNGIITKIPGALSKCKSEAESLNLMYRDFVLCTANQTALWWFDMFDGWFRSEGMMNAISEMIEINKTLCNIKTEQNAEVAVFAEGSSMYRVRKSSNLATVCLSDIRRTLASMGAPYNLYSICDLNLEEIDKYKVYIFVNQYDITDENKRIIEEKLKKAGKSILWIYAPDYAGNGNLNAKNISKITGINVDFSDTSNGKLVFKNETFDYPLSAPYFYINDETANALSYFENKKVSAGYKVIDGFKSFYVATPNLPPKLLRDILKLSDVHIYSCEDLVYTYVNSYVTGVYNASGKDCEINLAQDGKYKDLIEDKIYQCKNGKLKLPEKDINAFLLVREEK